MNGNSPEHGSGIKDRSRRKLIRGAVGVSGVAVAAGGLAGLGAVAQNWVEGQPTNTTRTQPDTSPTQAPTTLDSETPPEVPQIFQPTWEGYKAKFGKKAFDDWAMKTTYGTNKVIEITWNYPEAVTVTPPQKMVVRKGFVDHDETIAVVTNVDEPYYGMTGLPLGDVSLRYNILDDPNASPIPDIPATLQPASTYPPSTEYSLGETEFFVASEKKRGDLQEFHQLLKAFSPYKSRTNTLIFTGSDLPFTLEFKDDTHSKGLVLQANEAPPLPPAESMTAQQVASYAEPLKERASLRTTIYYELAKSVMHNLTADQRDTTYPDTAENAVDAYKDLISTMYKEHNAQSADTNVNVPSANLLVTPQALQLIDVGSYTPELKQQPLGRDIDRIFGSSLATLAEHSDKLKEKLNDPNLDKQVKEQVRHIYAGTFAVLEGIHYSPEDLQALFPHINLVTLRQELGI